MWWLPADAAVDEAEIAARLLPEERAVAEGMRHAQRREEYRRARWLVRALTGSTAPLPRGDGGEPTWPPGLVGSITHKNGAVGVAIAGEPATGGLGIDAEELTRVGRNLAPKIVAEAEEAPLADLAAELGAYEAALAVAFSVKEAVFKACFPRGRTMFYFHDAAITRYDERHGALMVRLLRDVGPQTPAGTELIGHVTLHGAFCLAAVALPPPAAGSTIVV